MNPTVSIIIPCHNAAAWVADCIASTRNQGIDEIETIFIDDGSQDESLKIVESLADDTFRIISQPNRGASSARNRGLEAATGQYIQYLDADDLLGKDKILQQLKRLRHAPSDSVATCRWSRFENGIDQSIFHYQDNFKNLSPLEFLQLNWEQDIMMHPAAWLTPRAVAERAGAWDESLTVNDDGEYFCRIALASSGILFTPNVDTYYRSNLSGSLSGRKDAASLLSLHSSIQKIEALLLSQDQTPRTQHACACARQRLAYALYPLHPKLADQSQARAVELAHGPLPEPGGGLTTLCSKLTGWKASLDIQRYYHQLLSIFR